MKRGVHGVVAALMCVAVMCAPIVSALGDMPNLPPRAADREVEQLAINAAVVEMPPTSFVIMGNVTYENGTPVLNPSVSVRNIGTSEDIAVRTSADSSLYIAVTDSEHVRTNDTLLINGSDSSTSNANETAREVTEDHMESGGFTHDIVLKTPQPDITVRKIALKTAGYVNEENVYAVEVKNTGSADASEFDVSFMIDSDVVGVRTISSLRAGESAEVEFSWTPSEADAYVICAYADVNDDVEESDETNNMLKRTSVIIKRDEWAQFHYDEAHIGFSPAEMGGDKFEIAWSQNIGAIASTSVAVADGKVFAYSGPSGFGGEEDTKLHCFDLETGDELWNVTLMPAEWGSWSSPAYHDGKVFTATGKDTRCYNASTGELIWVFHHPTEEASCNGGPVIADGKVITNDWQGRHYYCLDEETGELLWTFEETNTGSWGTAYAQGTPAYAEVDGLKVFYLTTWIYPGGNIYCVNASTGEVIWHQTTPLDTCGSPAVADVGGCKMVFVTTYNFYGDGDLYALNASTGDVIWHQSIMRTDSTPSVAYGNVYVAGGCTGYSDIRTYCFNATTGDLIWETPVELGIGGWTQSVAVADGKVFVGKPGEWFDYAGIYALDAFTGNVLWNSSEGGASPAVAVAGDDAFVLTIGNGTVYAFRSVPKADLTVESVRTPERLRAEVTNEIKATVANIGASDASGLNISLAVDGTIVDVVRVDSLPAGENRTVKLLWTPPEEGNFTLNVTVDVHDEVEEINETNNSLVEDVTVLPKLTVTVDVRIEGRNDTIWTGTLTFSNSTIITDDGIYYLNEPTALGALDEANKTAGFGYKVSAYPWGLYVYEVAGEAASGYDGWMYRVNFIMPWAGASEYTLSDGDSVLWYYGSWTTKPLNITIDRTVTHVGENITVTVTAYNDTSAQFEPVENASVYADNCTYFTDASGNATFSFSTVGNYTIYAAKGSWKDYVRSEKRIVTVLSEHVGSYGSKVIRRRHVIFAHEALGEPDETGALMLENATIVIKFDKNIRQCDKVSVWARRMMIFRPKMYVDVSSDGVTWTNIGSVTCNSFRWQRYDFMCDENNVQYIRIRKPGSWHRPKMMGLDAVYAEGFN